MYSNKPIVTILINFESKYIFDKFLLFASIYHNTFVFVDSIVAKIYIYCCFL